MRSQIATVLLVLFMASVGCTLVGAAEKDSLAELRKEKLAAAQKWHEAEVLLLENGHSSDLVPLYSSSLAWKTAEYELASSDAERLAALKAHKVRMEVIYEGVHIRFESSRRGGEAEKDAAAKFWLTEAKIWILEEKPKK